MNIVAHMTPVVPESTIASARIANFIATELGYTLVDRAENVPIGPIERLVIVNGPMAFCGFLDELGGMVLRAKQVVWAQNDYTLHPPAAESNAKSPFRAAFAARSLRPTYWTTVLNNVQEGSDAYVNWNQLTWAPIEPSNSTTTPELLYYGAYRTQREEAFKRFFDTPLYQTLVSTTVIRGKKFRALNPNIIIVPPFKTVADYAHCRLSLYIADKKSCTQQHSPANRFYECISARIPLLFDATTVRMLAESGLEIDSSWQVTSPEEVLVWLKDETRCKDLAYTQFERFNSDYRDVLRMQLFMAERKLS